MIQERSIITVADNTGATKIRCFRMLGGSYRKYASLGDIIIASVFSSLPTATINKGEKVRAVIVRCVKEVRRIDGSYIKFDDNAAVIINEENEPRGTRIFGPVARELREKNFLKIISLAPEVI